MLFPQESETRETKELSGIWQFRVDWKGEGYTKGWFQHPLERTIPMPVPSSYNDITQDPEIRDFIGDVWYERFFFVPRSWEGKSIHIYFGSVTHRATVYINGEKVTQHTGGFLPFQADITNVVKVGKENRVTVVVNNILDNHTLPPGRLLEYNDDAHPPGFRVQEIGFDFFNYAGIHRPVKLLALPREYITDIKVTTNIDNGSGIVDYLIKPTTDTLKVEISVSEPYSTTITKRHGSKGTINIPNANLWSPADPFLYNLTVKILDKHDRCIDTYHLPFGIRTIRVENNHLLLNNEPIYLKGFGMHEDMDIKGKGFDNAILVKNFNLLKWIGANSIRTSHYPYSEEFMFYADREGILIIDELPASGMNTENKDEKIFEGIIDEKTLQNHLKTLEELIDRDKNHPSVIMWSIANEAATYEKNAEAYFLTLFKRARELDPTRPVTVVENSSYSATTVSKYVDVLSVNRYYSWYEDPGHLELIEYQLERDLRNWHNRFKKPIIVTEYGTDAIPGLHSDPPVMFSEEYQVAFLERYHKVFDKLNFIVGEHVWNFADFMTKQSITRVNGNRKGIFTRQRQPKSAAFYLKKRWENKK